MSAVIRVHEDDLGWNESVRTYQSAPFTGVSFRLHHNGKLMFEIPYIAGRADGRMRRWDSEGRIICERVLGESLWTEIDEHDPDYAFLAELIEKALGRLSHKHRAMLGNISPSGTETTVFEYDSEGNLLFQIVTRKP